MKINEKLMRPISEVNYLRAENVDRYRVIIRLFYEEYEKIRYWLFKEDVYEIMKETGYFDNYTIENCQSDLESLLSWGNLTAIQDTKSTNTLEEFKNRKYRYQLSEYTIEIERMTIRLENLEIEGASLEPTLLERIRKTILELPNIVDEEVSVVSSWWNDLNSDFIRLNRNYQDYIRTLNSVEAEEMMKTNDFLLFKEKIIQYLRSFVKELQDQSLIIESFLMSIDENYIKTVMDKVVEYELSIPRIDKVILEEDIRNNIEGRWLSIYRWFVAGEDESEVNRMSDITIDMIRKITRFAQQIGERYNFGANKKEEYRHISKIFGMCESIEEAHLMSAMVFGVDHTFHLKDLNVRETDSIDSGVFDEAPTYYDLEPRTRVQSVKVKRTAQAGYELERMIQLQEILDEQEAQHKKLSSYIRDGVLEFEHIEQLDSYSRGIFLTWISDALSSESKTARTQWGDTFTLDDSNKEHCTVICEDGELTMPKFKLYFDEVSL